MFIIFLKLGVAVAATDLFLQSRTGYRVGYSVPHCNMANIRLKFVCGRHIKFASMIRFVESIPSVFCFGTKFPNLSPYMRTETKPFKQHTVSNSCNVKAMLKNQQFTQNFIARYTHSLFLSLFQFLYLSISPLFPVE